MLNLVFWAEQFAKRAMEQDPLAEMLAIPGSQDEQDLKIILKRAISAALDYQIKDLIKSLKNLEKLARTFRHEYFSPEFLDFLADEELWGWVETKESSILSEQEKLLVHILGQELLYLAGQDLLAGEQ